MAILQHDRRRLFSHCEVDVLNLVSHPIWVFDILNKSMWWGNTAAVEFWNAETLGDLTGRNFADDMSETTHNKNLHTLERLKRNEKWDEVWTFYPNGKPKSSTIKISSIRIENGNVCLFVEAFPIEEKADNEFLRGSTMLRYLPIAVSQFDKDGTLMEQNPEACRVFGSPAENAEEGDTRSDETATTECTNCSSSSSSGSNKGSSSLHQSSSTLVSPCDNDDVITTSDCGEALSGENSTQNPTNNDAARAQPLQDQDDSGLPCSCDGAAATTTHQGSAQHRCEVDTTVKKDDDRQFEESKLDAMDKRKNHFLSRFVDRKVGMKIFNDVKAGKTVNVEALVKTKEGSGWNAIHARLARDAVSEDPIILYSATDISEIVNAKKETQVNKERAEFFAIMAHEIRTPLFQVTGFIDLLNETQLSNEQRDYVKLLRTSASSLMAVINDVLDYSKLEAGKMKLDIVPFEPRAVVDGSLAAVAPRLEEKGLRLSSSFATGVPVRLMGDPNRLRQILLNLLNNAVKFTHEGQIEASVDLKEDDKSGRVVLKFSVTDTGIGIDPRNLSDIFRQYNQAAPAIATAYGGTGLGLSICKSLVSCMGGSIGVDSTIGEGSTFWFEVPLDRATFDPQISAVLDDDSKKEDVFTSLRILVAEDNGVSQKLISKMLGRLGHEVTIVDNGEEAVKEVQRRVYDMILMDMQMPVMDGIDATKEIRCLGLTLPILGLTASVRREDFENIGLNDWIGKPVRLNELQAKLTSVF